MWRLCSTRCLGGEEEGDSDRVTGSESQQVTAVTSSHGHFGPKSIWFLLCVPITVYHKTHWGTVRSAGEY